MEYDDDEDNCDGWNNYAIDNDDDNDKRWFFTPTFELVPSQWGFKQLSSVAAKVFIVFGHKI